MTNIVYGTGNSNFTVFRSLRYYDPKRGVLVMKRQGEHGQDSNDKRDYIPSTTEKPSRTKSRWIRACNSVKDKQHRKKNFERKIEVKKTEPVSNGKHHNLTPAENPKVVLKQLVRGQSHSHLAIKKAKESRVCVTNLNVKRTKNEMNPLSREKSCSLENLINKHSFFSK